MVGALWFRRGLGFEGGGSHRPGGYPGRPPPTLLALLCSRLNFLLSQSEAVGGMSLCPAGDPSMWVEHHGEGEQASLLRGGEMEGLGPEGSGGGGAAWRGWRLLVRGLGCTGRAFGEQERFVQRPWDEGVRRWRHREQRREQELPSRCGGGALRTTQAQGGLPAGLERGPQAGHSLTRPFAAPRGCGRCWALGEPPARGAASRASTQPGHHDRRGGCQGGLAAQAR